MEIVLYSGVFLGCAMILYVSGEWVVQGMMRISRLFGIREFVLAFFVMAMASSIPNLFLGVTSALRGVSELSLGDVFGNNIIAMTVAVAASVFFARRKFIEAEGQTVKTAMIFTAIAAILPVILIIDGNLGRVDGIILIGLFLTYTTWLISQNKRFSKKYNGEKTRNFAELAIQIKKSIKSSFLALAGVALLILAAIGIVSSASFFAARFGISTLIIGLFIVGLGNALPEIYFSVASVRRGETSFVMSNLMGAVIVPATLVLGVVALIHPIETHGLALLTASRVALITATLLFFVFAVTHRRIDRIEATILLILYIAFVSWAAFVY